MGQSWGQLSPSSFLSPGLIWSGSDPSRESGGLCRGVASSGSPRTCFLDLTCTPPFKVLLCFLEGLASPWFRVVVDHFFKIVSLKWLVRVFLFALCSNLFFLICQSSSAHHAINSCGYHSKIIREIITRKWWWEFPEVQWLRVGTSTVGGEGSVPGRGTKSPDALWHCQKL